MTVSPCSLILVLLFCCCGNRRMRKRLQFIEAYGNYSTCRRVWTSRMISTKKKLTSKKLLRTVSRGDQIHHVTPLAENVDHMLEFGLQLRPYYQPSPLMYSVPLELVREIIESIFNDSTSLSACEEPGRTTKPIWSSIESITLASKLYRALAIERWFRTLFIKSSKDLYLMDNLFPEMKRTCARWSSCAIPLYIS